MTRGGVDGLQLVILSSASGAGKTTLWHMLIEDPALDGMHVSISHTTRPPRGRERDGVDYHFVDEAGFARMIESGGFVEHARVHGNLYGTSVAELERIAAIEGARSIVFDIDVQGARQLLERHPHALAVFILPPSIEELERRLAARGTESGAELKLRLENAVVEMAAFGEFSHIVVNDQLDGAYRELRTIVEAHRCSTHLRRARVEALLGARPRERKP